MTALSLIEQDSSRIAKSLMPTHTVGTRPVLRKLTDAHKEAEWIVTEIRRCMGLTGDLLDLNDFAILLRSASLSRLIESALGKAGIAYKMVGGLRFYDRVEVKTLLDYLRVIQQPDNNDALTRIINTPARRIGEATIKALLEEADREKIPLWTLALGKVQGNRIVKTKLAKQTEQGLSSFINIILTARNKLVETSGQPCTIVEIIELVLKRTNYEDWLEEHHDDVHKARWANVEELITQAADFQALISCGYEDEALPQVDGIQQEAQEEPLSRFLANVALASEVKTKEETVATAQVTISTIHAAKGLEWPVVFIPATYQGSIPHSRAEDTNEERRLLYVAMTRAQALLCMCHPLKNSQGEQATLSPFLSSRSLTPLLESKGPSLRSSTVKSISQILRRPMPTTESIQKSSELLESVEDDRFPVGDEAQDEENESRWMTDSVNPTFTMGQRPPKRQRVDYGRVNSNSGASWKGNYITTMQRSSTFTTAMPSSSGFVNVGSHFQALSEQSVNTVRGREVSEPHQEPKSKPSKRVKPKRSEGQGTLMSFLGKTEPEMAKLPVSNVNSCHELKQTREMSETESTINTINKPRGISFRTDINAIEPSLFSHRLGSNPPLPRPRPLSLNDQAKRKDYVFLSSSPPRAQAPSPPLVAADVRKALPVEEAVLRPANTMHTTSISLAHGSGYVKRTLGVKRSMNGWGNRNANPFVPPRVRDA